MIADMKQPRVAVLLAALCLLLVAAPAAAYIIYLNDGSKIVARGPYEVIDGTAHIVLTNGTRTSIDASEIDVSRTEDANSRNLGAALVLEGGQVRELAPDEIQRRDQQRQTLADLISNREDPAPTLPGARREPGAAEPGELSRTEAGFYELSAVPPRPFRDPDLATEIKQSFTTQGIDKAEVYQGTSPDRALLRVTASSEATVFRALAVACATLLRLQETEPDRLGAVEMVLATTEGERAGQFVIDPAMATQLMTKQVDISTFYLAHVQF